MTNSKSTKRALVSSAFAILVCAVMLIGTTFAWFTDTASTAVNKIQSGNLDVELEYSKDFSSWTKVTDTTKLFDESALWEPGRTEIIYLRVKNAGKLALKYNLGIYNLYDNSGKNVEGKKYKLSDYVKLGAAETSAAYATRADSINAVSADAKTLINIKNTAIIGENQMVVLEPNSEAKTYAMVLYMPTDVGNEANPKNSDSYWAAKVSFGIIVNATQAVSESDSFGNDYDENTPTKFEADSSSSETKVITANIQANGRFGVVQAEKKAKYTINADVYAVYNKGTDGIGAAMAVQADGDSKVIINGGDFRQVSVPDDDPVCDLIYALGNAQIEINGGTFKAVTPANTLNCKDGSNAKIIVNGGRFYKYDPSNPTLGANEVFLGADCKVTQDGDWFVVSK